jgi:hypothetical protein
MNFIKNKKCYSSVHGVYKIHWKMLCTMGENELINTLVKGDSLFENYDAWIAEF